VEHLFEVLLDSNMNWVNVPFDLPSFWVSDEYFEEEIAKNLAHKLAFFVENIEELWLF